MQLNCPVNQITNAGGIFFTNCLFMSIPTPGSRSSPQKSRARVAWAIISWVESFLRACARAHKHALSLIVHRISVSAFQNSNARGAQVGFLVLDITATTIVRYHPTHLYSLSKRLRTNGDYIIHIFLLRLANVSSSLLGSPCCRQRFFGAAAFDEKRTLNHPRKNRYPSSNLKLLILMKN